MTNKLFLINLLKILLTIDEDNLVNHQVNKKNFYNIRINRLCKNYFRNLNVDDEEKVKRLFIIGFLIRFLYNFRVGRFEKFKSKLNLNLYVRIVYIFWNAVIILRFFRTLKNLGLFYAHNFTPNQKLIFAADFPSHAFSFGSNYELSSTSSFAEFLKKRYGESLCLVSLDEYIRASKTTECQKKLLDSELKNLERIKLRKKFSIILFIKRLLNFIETYPISSLKSIFDFLRAIYHIESMRYQQIISQVNCETFYVLPFSEFNYFDGNSNEFIRTFQYSENFIVPPFNCGGVEENTGVGVVTALLNPGVLSSIFPIEGFSSLYSRVSDDLIRELLGTTIVKESVKLDMPVHLGYETSFGLKSEGPFVAIFDNPPESIKTQFARSISGDITANEDFVRDFLEETFKSANDYGYKVLFKPKYSLENSARGSYKNLLLAILEKYRGNVILADPYARLGDILHASSLVISLPFTSTKTFADFMNIPSYYYVPKAYYDLFASNSEYLNKPVIGLQQLAESMAYIKNLNLKG